MRHMADIKSLHDGKRKAAIDTRYDSPGHSASQASTFMMDQDTKMIIGMETGHICKFFALQRAYPIFLQMLSFGIARWWTSLGICPEDLVQFRASTAEKLAERLQR